jgi:hypothetical protein
MKYVDHCSSSDKRVALVAAVIVQTTQELIHVTEETKCAVQRQTFVVQNVVRIQESCHLMWQSTFELLLDCLTLSWLGKELTSG